MVKMMNKEITFSDRLRVAFKWLLDPTGNFLNRIGLTPNMMTMLGLVGITLGAFFLARGQMFLGGLFILIMVPVDALDGTMARLRGEPSDFGAFVDSVSDRYSELATMAGLLYYFLSINDDLGAMLTFAAAAGSVLVSYAKARAEGLGFEAKVGLLTRVERYIVLAPSLLFNQPFIGVLLIAILANITAFQRILHVRAQGRERIKQKRAESQ